MSIYSVDPEYSVSALNSSVPPSVLPSMAQRPVAGVTSSMVSIVSQSSTQSAGGLLQINVPNQPNTYIKSGSSFLKATVTFTTVGAITAGTYTIKGGNAVSNWSSLILRATMSCGPNILEQINQYSVYDELLNAHAGSGTYMAGNMVQLYGQQLITSGTPASGTTYATTVCIPLNFGLLNSAEEQHFPLGLLNAGLQFQFDLQADLNQAIGVVVNASGAGLTSVTYAVSNVSFNYEAIKLPPDHFQALRAQMMQDGSLYQMPYVSALNMSLGLSSGSSIAVDQTFGLGLSSLKGAFATLKPTSAYNTMQYGARASMTQFRILLDGQMINQYSIPQIPGNLNADNEFYVDLQRALGVLGSVVRTAGLWNQGGALYSIGSTTAAGVPTGVLNLNANTQATIYNTLMFWAGLGCNRFCEHGLTYTGTPVSQLQIHAETINSSTGSYAGSTLNIMYLIFIYDSALFINAQGDVSINR